jgi:VanZ family protein
MAVIFVLSAREGLDTGDGSKLRFDVAKLAHLTVYFVLGALLDRAMAGHRMRRQAWWVMVVLVSYAITDEIHQAFVPGRTPLLLDIGIDAAGGLAGIFTWRTVFEPWLRRRAARRAPPATDDDAGAGPTVGGTVVSGSPAAGSGTGTAHR